MADRTAAPVLGWTEGGGPPVVIDATSCTHGIVDELGERLAGVRVLDSTQWAAELLPSLTIRRRLGTIAVHPTCSAGHLGVQPALEALLARLADDVLVPPGTTCCGMAGDRGLLHPELPRSALRDVVRDLEGRQLDAYVCANRTCEVALTRETGRPYRSFLFVLEE